jgi:hypothetical protein
MAAGRRIDGHAAHGVAHGHRLVVMMVVVAMARIVAASTGIFGFCH